MAINVTCGSCRYSSRVPDEHAGKEVICPQCGNSLRVPGGAEPAPAPEGSAPTVESKQCPHCSRPVTANSKACLWCGMPIDRPQTEVTEVVHRKDARMDPVAEEVPVDTKTCPFCAETIRAAARKCPHCNEILDAQLAASRRGQGALQGPNAIVQDLERKARDAFIISLFGLFVFCLGFILGPIAIIQGVQVNKEFSKLGKPSNGMATAAVIIGIFAILGFISFLVLQSFD